MSRTHDYDIYLLLFSGLAFSISAILRIRKLLRFKSQGEKTTGVVTQIEFDGNPDSKHSSPYPVIAFTTKDGIDITKRSEHWSLLLKRGDPVTVYYWPFEPDEFVVYNRASMITAVSFLLVGIASIFTFLLKHNSHH